MYIWILRQLLFPIDHHSDPSLGSRPLTSTLQVTHFNFSVLACYNMPALQSVDVQAIHHNDFVQTSWMSPTRPTIRELDPVQLQLTFNVMQTSPVAMPVQPAVHTQPGYVTELVAEDVKHENVLTTNIVAPSEPMISAVTLPDVAHHPSVEAAKTAIRDATPIANNLGQSVATTFALREVVDGRSSESTDTHRPQIENVHLSSSNDKLELDTSSVNEPKGKSSFNMPVVTESRPPLLAQSTTAEAATFALNAAFQSRDIAGPRRARFALKPSLSKSHGASSIPISEGADVELPSASRAPLYQVERTDKHAVHCTHKREHLDHIGTSMICKEHITNKQIQRELAAKAFDEYGSRHARAKEAKSIPFTAHATNHADTTCANPAPRPNHKKLVLDAVVIEKRPPFSPSKGSPKYQKQDVQVAHDISLVTETGPPGPPKQRPFVQIRKPKAPEVIFAKSEEQLEMILEARVADFDTISEEEMEETNTSIVANYDLIKLKWEVREPVKDESHQKAPSIVYSTDAREDGFVEGIESAFGLGSLFDIPKTLPKRLASGNRGGYIYTSSEPEESEIEFVSDVPVEEEQGQETIEPDTTTMEVAERGSAFDTTSEMMRVDGKEGGGGGEDVIMNGEGIRVPVKRKLSLGSGEDEERQRTHPRSKDTSIGTPVVAVDERRVRRWVALLEVLVKGKVHLGRQELYKLRLVLDNIYRHKNSLNEDIIEETRLKMRIRQLSEMEVDDIPFKDEENLRQRGRMISRFWSRRG
ncbi:hypothetical protein APHAL10511_005617 [Amanita phalloides]|nr:hypothetical protein APHAL10511_005617 [Amanita phalloides]